MSTPRYEVETLTIWFGPEGRKLPMEFCRIPAGTFRMGERGLDFYDTSADPEHLVTIPYDFYLGRFPVTQEQFALFKPEHENGFNGKPRHPAENMSWHQADAFCEWLGKHAAGIPTGYRPGLPVAAEWEYACRAGLETDQAIGRPVTTETEFWNGDGEEALAEVGWYAGNAGETTHPVGEKPGNGYGLHDMHGNVWEWCADICDNNEYSKSAWGSQTQHRKEHGDDQSPRVLRGGSWDDTAGVCRSAYRYWFRAGNRFRFFGFRVCLFPGSGGSASPAGGQETRTSMKASAEPVTGGGSGGTERKPEGTGAAGSREPELSTARMPRLPAQRGDFFAKMEALDPNSAETGKEHARALFSKEGKTWEREEERSAGPVCQIVIGLPPTDGSDLKSITLASSLWSEVLEHWETLTHLRLFQISDLTLPDALPPNLECLDLRGCEGLTALPDLPASLTELDLGRCRGLTDLPAIVKGESAPRLERLYLDGCDALEADELGVFLKALLDAPLRVFDASGCPAIANLRRVPGRALRKLVLKDCTALVSVEGIESFTMLEHLNLSGCTRLEGLPDIPSSLRYLRLHGAERLTLFRGQTIGEADRGTEEQNVARDFLTRKKFGDHLVVMPHAKLLLLGDGRVGKTTLTKRLQWNEMSATEQEAHPELRPIDGEPYTHSVALAAWQTTFPFPDALREKILAQAGNRKVDLPVTADGRLIGRVRIWDFGGQELYHATHRIFAREGSVYLIVWSREPAKLGKTPRDMTDEEWKEWNRPRPLAYWLDYIDALRDGEPLSKSKSKAAPEQLLVCTSCPPGTKVDVSFDDKAPRHVAEGRLPICHYVESVMEHPQAIQKLTDWIHDACLKEAEVGGRLLKPKFFGDTSQYLERLMRQNEGQSNPALATLLLEWDDWAARLKAEHLVLNGDTLPPLDDHDVQSVTNFLHEVGDLFQISIGGERAVIVDQKTAAKLIYRILQPGSDLRSAVRERGGYFYGAQVRGCAEWNLVEPRVKDLLLAYMEECRIIVKLAERNRSISDDDVYLALDKWLLPGYPNDEDRHDCDEKLRKLRERADAEMEVTRNAAAKDHIAKTFLFEEIEITEFQYRDLMVLVARSLRTNATYFSNSVQARNPAGFKGIFRMRWMPKGGDRHAYTGKVDAVIVGLSQADFDGMRQWLEELFGGKGSPFQGRFQPTRRSAQEHEMNAAFHQGRFITVADFGISSSGRDLDDLRAMREALAGESIRTTWYLDAEVRQLSDPDLGGLEQLNNFLKYLLRENRMIVVLSNGYLVGSEADLVTQDAVLARMTAEEQTIQQSLTESCERNRYCALELADTIVQLHEGHRPARDTIVILKTSPEFKTDHYQERVLRLLRNMNLHYRKLYAQHLAQGEELKFEAYRILYERFTKAASDAYFTTFMSHCGPGADHWRFDDISSGPKGSEGDEGKRFGRLLERLRERFPGLWDAGR